MSAGVLRPAAVRARAVRLATTAREPRAAAGASRPGARRRLLVGAHSAARRRLREYVYFTVDRPSEQRDSARRASLGLEH